ncbi:ATP-binding protein [Streptacidiphilus neutrinimicus]|uniref:ATP-binding protein n=1 Tax=Streptacidiphilus neutrinimicus TaxID=105420 RepID=UPI0006944883|nr:ATP-binding protein [Streptacidiphilus neutrinimicus]
MTIESAEIPMAEIGRVRVVLSEMDWREVLRQSHRYRCWAWSTSQVAAEGLAIAGVARGLVAEALADWRLGPMVDDVALCADELIGNAVTHGREAGHPALSLGLRYFPTSCLFVEVGDPSPEAPLLTWLDPEVDPAAVLFTDGRGLMIVRELADHMWWSRQSTGGKIVYARLDVARHFAPLAGGRRG